MDFIGSEVGGQAPPTVPAPVAEGLDPGRWTPSSRPLAGCCRRRVSSAGAPPSFFCDDSGMGLFCLSPMFEQFISDGCCAFWNFGLLL
jgi:hypothetical protein